MDLDEGRLVARVCMSEQHAFVCMNVHGKKKKKTLRLTLVKSEPLKHCTLLNM